VDKRLNQITIMHCYLKVNFNIFDNSNSNRKIKDSSMGGSFQMLLTDEMLHHTNS
jgi:hypothetical protein